MSMMNYYLDDNIASAATINYTDDDRTEKANCMLRWKSGKQVDSRLIKLLESFRELYVEQRELFKKVFPQLQDEFVEVFKKIVAASPKKDDHVKYQTMQRSLSFGSQRVARGIDESEVRLDRFKVKTPDVGGASSSGGQAAGTK